MRPGHKQPHYCKCRAFFPTAITDRSISINNAMLTSFPPPYSRYQKTPYKMRSFRYRMAKNHSIDSICSHILPHLSKTTFTALYQRFNAASRQQTGHKKRLSFQQNGIFWLIVVKSGKTFLFSCPLRQQTSKCSNS